MNTLTDTDTARNINVVRIGAVEIKRLAMFLNHYIGEFG